MSRARKQITAKHLQKDAVVYIRQSAPAAGRSAAQKASQSGLADVARRCGWPTDKIHIIDEDLGNAAASASRPGFNEVLRRIGEGSVGVLVVRDLSRLTRDAQELKKFTKRAEKAGTVVLTSTETRN